MTSIKMEITEGQVQNAIAVALAEAFSPEKRDALIRDVIRAHLSQKTNLYDKETLLAKSVGEMIRKMANEAMQERISEMAPRIREIVRSTLGQQFEDQVLNQVRYALGRLAMSHVTIEAKATFTEDDDR